MRRIRYSANKFTPRARWILAFGSIAVLALAAGVGPVRTDAQPASPLPSIDPPGAQAVPSPAAEQPAKEQSGSTAGEANGPEVGKECAALLKMASELKTAVDQSSAGTLSLTVVRKASEIAQFAHKVRVANGAS